MSGNNNETNNTIIKALLIVLAGLLVVLLIVVVAVCKLVVPLFLEDSQVADNGAGIYASEETDVQTIDFNGTEVTLYERPLLLSDVNFDESKEPVNISCLTTEPGKNLQNISNREQFDYMFENKDFVRAIEKNGFVVNSYGSNEFFETYESNRYVFTPNFVTVDSLLHTYHLYFQQLLKKTEKTYLSKNLKNLSSGMMEESVKQYEELKGTDWQDAAERNVAFFAVGAYLQDEEIEIPDFVSDKVTEELRLIDGAKGITDSPIMGIKEDYTQYSPRGYYEGDKKLEKYFKAMMWYGRIAFEQDEESSKSALLISLAMKENNNLELWKAIYSITSFFAGESDDLGYCEYMPVIEAIYGDKISVAQLPQKTDEFNTYCSLITKLEGPQVNSIPVMMNEENVIKSFRFMGQRFSVDAAIMQKLVYRNVKENSNNELRMLPSVLDTAAVLGSDAAYEILEERGDTDYNGYTENMEFLRDKYQNAPNSTWNSSLYASWLNTLLPLLQKKSDKYPFFMQSKAWERKEVETFAGSYTELKHDTILYSKQVIAEMGGGDIPEYDDRGYVEPQTMVYARFRMLAEGTRSGLLKYKMLSDEDNEDLKLLCELAEKLEIISEKELAAESLTDEEYELIRTYGGQLEHFWRNATIGLTGDENPISQIYPCVVVADIATDPNGRVLEVGTGRAHDIYAVVPVEGKLKLAVGTVYSFYEFEWPMDDRLTDTKWRQMLGTEMLDDGSYNYEKENQPQQPEWTQGYRW